ncbi:MAG TPA: hypothetical protein DCS43_06695 [Verrucomicrobia bacterium]|nr:hypothetical protein [Verrucomicrobiota bacterium]
MRAVANIGQGERIAVDVARIIGFDGLAGLAVDQAGALEYIGVVRVALLVQDNRGSRRVCPDFKVPVTVFLALRRPEIAGIVARVRGPVGTRKHQGQIGRRVGRHFD